MVIVLITLGLVAGSGCQHSASQPAAPKPPTIPVSRPVQGQCSLDLETARSVERDREDCRIVELPGQPGDS